MHYYIQPRKLIKQYRGDREIRQRMRPMRLLVMLAADPAAIFGGGE